MIPKGKVEPMIFRRVRERDGEKEEIREGVQRERAWGRGLAVRALGLELN